MSPATVVAVTIPATVKEALGNIEARVAWVVAGPPSTTSWVDSEPERLPMQSVAALEDLAIPAKPIVHASEPLEGNRTGSAAPSSGDRDLERALGNQIRVIRRQHDLSISELSAAAGISVGMMSKIENGGISPSLATLQAISTALQVPLSSLFASFEQREDCSYVPAGKGVTLERRGTKVGHVYELLGHVLRGEVAVEPYLITLRENAAAHTGFSHSGVEFIYMLEGHVDYRHGSEVYSLDVGDALLFDSSALHGPETVSGSVTRYLSIIVYPRNQA